ncbi:MAG: GMC family oxidoreductase [Gemmatimonas sp.]|nr:GMC family oxidoreductase [Gemmatimonas sp.]
MPRVDALVVGAGCAGGVATLRLAKAGCSVVCLEQGDWSELAEFPAPRPEYELLIGREWANRPSLRGRAADYPIEESDSDIEALMWCGVGGSLIMYAGDWCRLRPSDFRVRTLDGVADDWPFTYGDLAPHYEKVDIEFGASGLGGDPSLPPGADPPHPPLPIGPAATRVARAHAQLGWHWWPGTNSVLSVPAGGRRVCAQWSTCQHGCPEGAKASTDRTHFPEAVEHGAKLVTGARAHRVVLDGRGRATGVEYLLPDGSEHRQRADVILLAASAIGTPRLLLLSATPGSPDGLANGSGLVGRRLMMHPFANVCGYFDEDLRGWNGHWGAKIVSYEFYETDASRGFVRGAKWSLYPTGGPLSAAVPTNPQVAPVWGSGHHRFVRERLGRGVNWGIFGEDLPDPDNRVTLADGLTDSSGLPAPKLTYRLSEEARRLLEFNVERAEESFLAAGARHVERQSLVRDAGWHPLGTARAGKDPSSSVVDGWGRSHDVPNLFVVDGSVFPTSGAANPASTIAAFASRAVDHLIAERTNQKVPV